MVNRIYLASASPRRRKLIEQLGWLFDIILPDISELWYEGETPSEYVIRLACEKSQAGVDMAEKPYPVLGADTIVVSDGNILGKPKDENHAAHILRQLSGKTHQVMTAIAFSDKRNTLYDLIVTKVTLRQLTNKEIDQYILSGEPMDKAGAYAIQVKGGCFIKRIVGSYHAVVGLPLVETDELLTKFLALNNRNESYGS
ncbi:septum formation inhibitor Maf [Arsenophonus sp. ENCA]|uniref:Maf family protein n=1 Tax=Arsenophonus sp. ENCA TaxID=1987579 RepID=UPI000BD6155E|nr:Maf family protein [Arsenophonus sp. ENCA]PAV03827.1 septum formation inhibitor Maf [Arsenophonus sp. ENCA]